MQGKTRREVSPQGTMTVVCDKGEFIATNPFGVPVAADRWVRIEDLSGKWFITAAEC